MKKFLSFICLVLFAASSIQAQCDAPSNVRVNGIHWEQASLSWDSPFTHPDFLLNYEDDGTSTSIGANGTPFSAIVRFTPDSLTHITGLYLTHVRINLGSTNLTSLVVKVWQGGSVTSPSSMSPGTLIDSVVVNVADMVEGPNLIHLNAPITVDPTQELWIGYDVSAPSGEYPGGSHGPELNTFNDIILFQGSYMILSNAGVSGYGWDIAGVFYQTEPEITGFNILRDNVQINTAPVTDHSYVDTGLTPLTQYCYTIQSICPTTTTNSSTVCYNTIAVPNCEPPVGTGTGTNANLPFNCYYKYAYSQQLFSASELSSQPGTISTIGLQYMYSTPIVFSDVVIYMGNVNKTTFNSTSDWVPFSELEEVYRGSFSCNAADSFSSIVLSTPFEWDGTSSVVLAIAYNEGRYYSSGARFYCNSPSMGNTSLYLYQDESAYDPTNPPAGYLSNNRNNIRFCYGPVPACPKPSNPHVSNIQDNSAVVSWSTLGNVTEWELVCVPKGTSVDSGVPITVYDTTYTLTNLTDNTAYDIYIRNVCSDNEFSAWKKGSFRTTCVIAQTLPYTETFNGYGTGGENVFPFCWSRSTNNTSTNFPYITQNQLYFYSYNIYYSLAVSQPIDISAYSAGSLALSYKIKNTDASTGRFEVGIMTDPNNINTFTLLKSYYPSDFSSAGVFQEDIVTIPQAYSTPIYLAFYAPASNAYVDNYVFIDDVTLDLVPTCSTPNSLTVSSVTGTAATLSWNEAPYGASGYTLEYGPENGTMTPINTNEDHYMLTNLSIGTTYNVLLYSNCMEGSSDTLTLTFSTAIFEECVQPDTSNHEITGSSTTTYYTPVNNWYKYTYSQQIFTPAEVSQTPAHITGIAFEYNYSTPMSSKTDVDIYLAHRSSSTFASSSDWTPIDQATLVYHGALNCSQGWNTIDFDTYFPFNGNDNLVVIVDDNSNGYNGSSYTFNAHTQTDYMTMYYNSDSQNPDPTAPPTGTRSQSRNDIILFKCLQTAPMSCPPPMVYVSDVDDQSITVDWVSNGNETTWELEYQAENDTVWTSYGTATSAPIVLSGVTSDVFYNLRLRSVCSTTENSEWSTASVYVPCQGITIPFVENFEDTSYRIIPNCWIRSYNGSTASPSLSSQYAYSGNKSLYFYAAASNYAYAILPRFDDAVDMDNLQIQFYAFKTSDEYFIEVGILSDINDLNSFVSLGTVSPSVSNAWELGEIFSNSYTGNGHYVALRIPVWYYNNMYIDDVNIQAIPECPHVSNIYASNIEATSAVIKWTSGSNESAWSYIFGLAGTVDLDSDSPISCFEDSVVLTDLSPNTLYEIYIMANCGPSDESSWMSYTFRSGCAAINTLPYTENFDSYIGTTSSDVNILPNCWDRINSGSYYTGYPTIYSYGASSSPNCLAFYSYSSSYYSDQYAILPEIDTVTLPINTLQLSFDAMTEYSSYTFNVEVGVMTNPADPNTFELVDILHINSTSYSNYEVYFDAFTGNGQYIALRVPQPDALSYYNSGYIDNVVLSSIPECSAVRELTVSNIAGSSAMVTWEAGHFGSVNGYTLEYSEAGQDNWITASSSITQESFLLSGLNQQTTYEIRVATNCSTGPSEYTTATFTTRCLAGGDLTIDDAVTTTNGYLPSYSLYNYSYSQQIYTSAELGGANTFNGIVFYASTVPTSQRTLSIYLMHTNVSTSSSWLPASNAQLVFSGQATLQEGANTFNFTTPFQYNGVDNMALIVLDQTGSWSSTNYWYVHTAPAGTGASMYTYNDDAAYSISSTPTSSSNTNTTGYRSNITLMGDCDSTVTCIAPNISVINITENSATITWVAGYNETAWEMDYKLSSDTVWTPVYNPSNNSVQLTNLTPNTQYDVRMRSDCGGDYSPYNGVSFRTECGLVTTLPYLEDFNNYGTGTNVYPTCWSKLNTYSSDMPYIISSGYNNSGSLYFIASSGTYNLAILPEFDPSINLNTVQVSFMYKGAYTSDKLIVGVISNPTDFSTFVPLDTVDCTTDWEEYDIPLNSYQGDGHYIALLNKYLTTYAYAYVDNIVVDVISTCARPRDLEVMPASTSATLSWVEMGDATSWDIEYGNQGFALGSGTMVTATTNPFTINNLTSGTTYDFYVRANCGGGNESSWRGPVTTTPGSYNFPTSGQYTLSMCGGVLYDDGGPDGNYSLSCDVTVVVNPDTVGLYVQLNGTYEIETGTSSRWDYLQIFDGPDNTGTILFDSQNHDDLTNITSTTGPLTLYFHSDASITKSGFEIQVACVENTTPEPCNAPTNVTATNVTHESAVIDWTQEGTPDSWTISYKKSSASSWSTINTTTHPYTITNLDAETSYDVYVTATCGEQTSSQSATITFVTQPNSVNEYVMNSTLLYPNPTTGEFRIQNSELRIERVEVYDVYGKLMTSIEVDDHAVTIDASSFASGVYFTRVYTDKGTITKRIVKE